MSGTGPLHPPVGGAVVVLAASTCAARAPGVHEVERRVFRALNELPGTLHPPVYVVMQAGSLAAAFVTAGVARAAGRPRLALATAVAGSGVWAAAKVMKRWVDRGRPAAVLDDVRVRGNEEAGLGFPSGHAAVACCLATLVAPSLPGPVRPLLGVVAGVVAAARVYVGAHLPLDVVGGAALGVLGGHAGLALVRATRP